MERGNTVIVMTQETIIAFMNQIFKASKAKKCEVNKSNYWSKNKCGQLLNVGVKFLDIDTVLEFLNYFGYTLAIVKKKA